MTITELVEAKLAAHGLSGWTWSVNSAVTIHRALAVIEGGPRKVRIAMGGDTPDAALDKAIAQAVKGSRE